MRTMKVRVSTQVDGRFDGVARLIAKGDPPHWLTVGLQHFSDGIGVEFTGDDRRSFEKTVEQMQASIDYLMKKLPMYVLAAYGEECPEPVTLALYVLPKLRAELDLLPEDGTGRRPDHQREICAAVVLESWKLIHGKAQPYSDKFLEACRDYWLACGGPEIGEWNELRNWRRPIKHALATDYSNIRDVLTGLQNTDKSTFGMVQKSP